MILFLFFALVAVKAFELPITENGNTFKQVEESHHGFTGGLQQIIQVPQHNNVDGITIFNDFQVGVSIYRTDAHPKGSEAEEKMCYVITMNAEEKREFKDLELGMDLLSHASHMPEPVIAPTSYEKDPSYFMVTGTETDLSPGYLAVAKQHCGSNRIVPAIKVKTSEEASKWATERLRSSNGNRVRRDTSIRDIFTCDLKAQEYAMASIGKCKGVMNDVQAVCTFRMTSCAYIISCPYSTKLHHWLCKGKHSFNNPVCCNYECVPGSGKAYGK